jgi:hypothetical protein
MGVRNMPEATPQSERVVFLKQKAFLEFKKFIVTFLYLWVIFALLSIHESIIRAQNHLDYPAHTLAVINAFIFAKVLLIGEYLRLGTGFRNRPLIYSVLYKCFSFSLLLVGMHVVEKIIVGVISGKTAGAAFSEIGGRTLINIVSMATLAFVMLIPFFAFRELGRVIGEKELRSLFLGRRGKLDAVAIETTARRTTEDNILAK